MNCKDNYTINICADTHEDENRGKYEESKFQIAYWSFHLFMNAMFSCGKYESVLAWFFDERGILEFQNLQKCFRIHKKCSLQPLCYCFFIKEYLILHTQDLFLRREKRIIEKKLRKKTFKDKRY